MNRRGFLSGLGALLATTSLVKPASPAIEAVSNTIDPAAVLDEMFASIMDRMDTRALGDALLYGKPIKTFYDGHNWGFEVIDDLVEGSDPMWFIDNRGHLNMLPGSRKPDYDRDMIRTIPPV